MICAGLLLTPVVASSAEFTSGAIVIRPKGRLLIDAVSQEVSPPQDGKGGVDQVQVRQAFLGLDAKFGDRLSLRLEGGVANNDAFVWDEAALEYRVSPQVRVAVGNLKAAGLENLTSTKATAVMERGPYGDLIADPFTSALQVRITPGPLAVTLAVQGDTFSNLGLDFDGAPAPGARDRRGITARFAGAVPLGDRGRLHVGAWVRAREFGDRFPHAYAARPGASVGKAGDWLGSGPVARSDATVALEGAWLANSVWIQGEVAALQADRSPQAPPGGDPLITSGYVFVGWNVTGEPRGYDVQRALVTAPRVGRPVSEGGRGSLDLVARFDFADLTDVRDTAATAVGQAAARRAGAYKGLTLGAVWRPEPGYRLVFNLCEARIDHAPPGPDLTIRQLQIRAQYEF